MNESFPETSVNQARVENRFCSGGGSGNRMNVRARDSAPELRMLRDRDTRDALKVGGKLNLLEASVGEERCNVWLLAETELEDEVAAGDEGGESGRDETAVDFETVGASE